MSIICEVQKLFKNEENINHVQSVDFDLRTKKFKFVYFQPIEVEVHIDDVHIYNGQDHGSTLEIIKEIKSGKDVYKITSIGLKN